MTKRRTREEMAEDLGLTLQLMDQRVPSSTIAALLMERGLSRSSAYRQIAEASEQRGREGIQAAPNGTEIARATQSILLTALAREATTGDGKLLPRLAKELRESLRMTGDYAGNPPLDEQAEQLQQAHHLHTNANSNGKR